LSPARPLGASAFQRLMAALGPLGPRPEIAVGVSGGRDSLALVLLLDHWARARNGSVRALSVDHGLRPGAAAEARQVGRWMKAQGIRHTVLRWAGPKPATGLAAEARAARFGLLADWCRGHGVLFLALAHHLEDQAETVLLRIAGGSGADGLAAMAPRVAGAHVAVIRPLLGVPRARLTATLEAIGQPWIEDPSNADPRQARVRVRAIAPALAGERLDADAWAAAARKLGESRAIVSAAVERLIARAVTLDPAGFALLAPAFFEADPLVQARALGRVLCCVGGTPFPPPADALARVVEALVGGTRTATLGRCRIVELGRAPGLLVCREARNLPDRQRLADATAGAGVTWDGRFDVSAARVRKNADARPRRTEKAGPALAPLGERGWRTLLNAWPDLAKGPVPRAAAVSLPALWDGDNLLSVPQLVYNGNGSDTNPQGGQGVVCAFRPLRPLSGPGSILV
jgi:tRNA(Ile)-lysidine synthase